MSEDDNEIMAQRVERVARMVVDELGYCYRTDCDCLRYVAQMLLADLGKTEGLPRATLQARGLEVPEDNE